MSLGTYSDVVTAVGTWLARSDLSTYIPDFIRLVEARCNRDLRTRQMEQRSTASVNSSSAEPQYISIPSDFQAIRWIRLSGVSGKPKLDYLTPDQMEVFRTARGDASGRPTKYTIFGDEIELCPTPDTSYALEMIYRKNIPAISSSVSSNWLLDLAPDVYLFGSLAEAAPFMRADERVPLWQAKYDAAVDSLNKVGRAQSFNASSLSMRADGPVP